MKKQLLSLFAALIISTGFAQVPAAAWATNQDAMFPTTLPNTGVKFMDAVDANVVWVIGKDYAPGANNRNYNWYSRSTDGGATFAGGNIFNDTNTYVIANLEGLDANTAWVTSYKKVGLGAGPGSGALHRTTNGGANWVNMTAPGMYTNTASFANWVAFLTPSVAIANGDPVNGEYELWRTTDGGLTWNLTPGANIPDPLTGEFAIVNLYAKVGTSDLWFGTNGNRMFHSTDAGLTYSVTSIGAPTNTITEIAFSSPLNGVCYMFNGANIDLWNTFDGGVTWNLVPPSANLGLFDVVQVPGTGMLVSFGAGNANQIISYSNDNGVTWNDFGSSGISYITGDFVDGSTGWAGSFDFTDQSTIFTDVWKFSGALSGTVSPSSAFSLPATLCLSGSAVTTPVNSSVGSPALSYSWTALPSGVTFSNPTDASPTITFASTGTYTVVLTATNSIGTHSSSAVVVVAACTAPAAVFSTPVTACTGFSLNITNTSSGAPTPGYLWSVSPSNNVTLTPATGATPIIEVGTAGVYTVTLISSNASGTAQATQVVTVGLCPPIVDFEMQETVCLDSPTTQTFSANSTGSVSNPAGATGGSFTYTWSISPNPGTSNIFGSTTPKLNLVKLTGTTPKQYTVTLKVKNPSGTTSVAKILNLTDCTGLTENNALETNLLVYPNPAHEQINISIPGSNQGYKVKLTNLLGSVVFEDETLKNSKETTTIDLAGKAKGVYFLTVESNNEKTTKKIIVE